MENMSNGLPALGSNLGTAFIVLGCLILLCLVLIARSLSQMSAKLRDSAATPSQPAVSPAPVVVPPAPAAPAIENRSELMAAVSAAIAVTIGGDVSGIRILSVKKVSC